MDKEWFKKNDKNIVYIITTFDVETSRFLIGGQGLKIRKSDITLIFGIEDGVDPIVFPQSAKKMSPFVIVKLMLLWMLLCN